MSSFFNFFLLELCLLDKNGKGTMLFNSTAKKKIAAVKTALKTGLDVLFSDTDIFWCKDAGTFLNDLLEHEHYRDADVLIQPDAGYRTLNSGFFFVRSSVRALALFNQLLGHVALGAHDHDVVNKVICESEYGDRKNHEPYGEVPFRCESHGAVIRVLPSQLFPSGKEQFGYVKVFSHSRSALKAMCKRKDFVILSNNFIHTSRKKARLIQKELWYAHFDEENQPKCEREPVPGSIAAAQTCGAFC